MSEQPREDPSTTGPPRHAEAGPEPATVGTGSSIAVGCVVAVILLLVIAVALRAFTSLW